LDAREKAIQDKKSAREAEIAERQAAQLKRRDSLKAAAAARRQKIIDDRAKAKAERDSANAKTPPTSDRKANTKAQDSTTVKTNTGAKTPAQIAEEKKQQKIKDREARKKALEERKKKIIADRKKAKEEREAKNKAKDSVPDDN